MADSYFALSAKDRRDALGVAAAALRRPDYLLEKDVWVVSALNALFTAEFADHLTFKGGTSLSKAYKVIRRFSEDVDVTYDIRALLPEETKAGTNPSSRSEADRWTTKVKDRLDEWVSNTAVPAIKDGLTKLGAQADARASGESVIVKYAAVTMTGSSYVKPEIKIEFGARSTGEPSEILDILCDAAEALPSVAFPRASVQVMKPERTFWEKATAAHVYTVSGKLSGAGFARHFYDLAMLDRSGHAAKAIADRETARAVAEHKTHFFRTKDSEGAVVDYFAAVNGALRLVPIGSFREALAADYSQMTEAGLFEADAINFDEIMIACGRIEAHANSVGAPQESVL